MSENNKYLAGAAAVAMAGLTLYMLTKKTNSEEPKQPESIVALLGDIGGTNVRLTLKRLCLKTRTSTVLLELKKYKS